MICWLLLNYSSQSYVTISVDNCVAFPDWSLGQGHQMLCQKQGEALLPHSLGPLMEGNLKNQNLRG